MQEVVKMKAVILFLLIAIFLVGCSNQVVQPNPNYNYISPHITDIPCGTYDLETMERQSCPQDLECLGMEGGAKCVDKNPCEWYCENQGCLILESDPPSIKCE